MRGPSTCNQLRPQTSLHALRTCSSRPARCRAASTQSTPPTHNRWSPTSTLESSVDEAVQSSGREALQDLGIAPVEPGQLFDQQHIQQWDPLLLAYLPFGCVLALLRMVAWIGGIALDASWFRNPAVVDAYMALLGVTVEWEGERNIPQERHVLVSNHITTGDLLMLFQRPQRYVHLITTALPDKVYACEHLPAILQPANKHKYLELAEAQQQQQPQQQHEAPDLSQHHHQMDTTAELHLQHTDSTVSSTSTSTSSSNGRHVRSLQEQQQVHVLTLHPLQHEEQHRAAHSPTANINSSSSSSSHHLMQNGTGHLQQPVQQTQQQQQQPSVHLFPEGGMTNGKGMMRFSRGFMLFADKLPVVPVALRVQGAFPHISSHTLDSNFLANLFWCSFQPWTRIQAKALPPMRLAAGESKAAFVQRVQLAIAEELRVWITDLSVQQKRQLAAGAGAKRRKGGRS